MDTADLMNVASSSDAAQKLNEMTRQSENTMKIGERLSCEQEEYERLRQNMLSVQTQRKLSARLSTEHGAQLAAAAESAAEETARLRKALAAQKTARLSAAMTNLVNVAADLKRKLKTSGAENELEGRDREARESSVLADEIAALVDEITARLRAERKARDVELRAKEDELARQRMINLELKNEKERLQDTINNIQKLHPVLGPPLRLPKHDDDNVIMPPPASPAPKRRRVQSAVTAPQSQSQQTLRLCSMFRE